MLAVNFFVSHKRCGLCDAYRAQRGTFSFESVIEKRNVDDAVNASKNVQYHSMRRFFQDVGYSRQINKVSTVVVGVSSVVSLVLQD